MKKMITWLLVILLIVAVSAVGTLVVMSMLSHRGAAPGIVDGQLAPCSSKPNCVCSESFGGNAGSVAAIPFTGSVEKFVENLQMAIAAEGGSVTDQEENYIAATFESGSFRFVDDVEFRILPKKSIAHVRSASRVGYSDMGVNRKRVEAIASRLKGQ